MKNEKEEDRKARLKRNWMDIYNPLKWSLYRK